MCSDSIRQTCLFLLIVIIVFATSEASVAQDSSATDLRRLGRQAFDEGRYSDADRYLRLALDEFEKGGNSFETAASLGDLAAVLVAQERYSQAEPLLDRALALMPEGDVRHPSETARLLGNLAALYVHTGRRSDAQSAFKRALRVVEQYAKDDPHIVVLLSNVGALHVQNGNYKEARAEFEKALKLAQLRLESNHRDFAPLLNNLAALYQRQKKWSRAESYLLSAAAVAERAFRPDHPERAAILEHLGVVQFRQKKLAEAERNLRLALEIENHAL